jgi:hypothetical protein
LIWGFIYKTTETVLKAMVLCGSETQTNTALAGVLEGKCKLSQSVPLSLVLGFDEKFGLGNDVFEEKYYDYGAKWRRADDDIFGR